jgi:hypothetical protein
MSACVAHRTTNEVACVCWKIRPPLSTVNDVPRSSKSTVMTVPSSPGA